MTINQNPLDDRDKIKQKVQKLLNQANDREGTPEGDVFYAKAFALMAEYGFAERDLNAKDSDTDVVHKTIAFTGSYTDAQHGLLWAIANALHCTGFSNRKRRSPAIINSIVFGDRRHLDRVEMLYSMLNPMMLSAAKNLSSDPWRDGSLVVKRRSFMEGFASIIGSRLEEAEGDVSDSDERYALVLVDDFDKARAARDEYLAGKGFELKPYNRNCSFDADAWGKGVNAGKMADIGQDRLVGQLALGR